MSRVSVFSLCLLLSAVAAQAQQVRQVEYFFDTDPGYEQGKRISTSVTGNNQLNFDLEGIAPGSHTLFVRSQDTGGHWSATVAHPLLVTSRIPTAPRRLEYFLDADPGYGLGAVLSNLKIGDNALTFDLSAAKDGAHVLYVRSQDDTGLWSTTMSRPLFIDRYQDIVYVEYFYDDNDPGRGNATPLPLPDVAYKGHLEWTADFDISGLALGQHLLTVRALDRYDQWTDEMSRPFTIVEKGGDNPDTPPLGEGDLARLEYFFDVDPGYGQGRPLSAPSTGTNNYVMSFEGIQPGAHVVYLRAWDDENHWSQTLSRPVYVCSVSGTDISRLEYFFDADPGYGNGRALSYPRTPAPTYPRTYVMSFDGIQPGAHVLNVRALNNQGRWSTVVTRPLYVYQPSGKVLELEYFFDDADPGAGQAKPVALPQNLLEPFAFDVSVNGLPAGMHHLCVRAKGDDGKWSLVSREPFIVAAPSEIVVGDVNADGEVGIGDIVAITNVMAGINTDAGIEDRADVNGDGEVGIGDIVSVTNIMAGIVN